MLSSVHARWSCQRVAATTREAPAPAAKAAQDTVPVAVAANTAAEQTAAVGAFPAGARATFASIINTRMLSLCQSKIRWWKKAGKAETPAANCVAMT
jgi:hypothetical protein